MFSQRIVILRSLKYLKWPDTSFLITRVSGDSDATVIFFLQNTKILVSSESLFYSNQLLTRKLVSLLTSLGDIGCQSLLDYAVKLYNQSHWSLYWKIFWLAFWIYFQTEFFIVFLKEAFNFMTLLAFYWKKNC